MEGLAALSLVSSIATLLDVGTKLVTMVTDIQQSAVGAIARNQELFEMTQNFELTLAKIKSQPKIVADSQLASLVRKCTAASRELSTLLQRLRVGEGASRSKALRLAVRNHWRRKTIESLNHRLEAYRQEMHLYLSVMNQNQCQSNFAHLVSLLESGQAQLTIIEGDVGNLGSRLANSPSALSPDVEAAAKAMLDRFIRATQHVRESRVLSRLRPRSLYEPFDDLSEAQAGSYDWLLDEADPNLEGCEQVYREGMGKARDNFVQWLRQEEGIFRISGKPGSGKSTLLKYLWCHRKTKEYLEEWARKDGGNNSLVTGKFFFCQPENDARARSGWNGLVQGLLYSIVSNCPGIIPVLFPEEWEASSRNHHVVFDGFGNIYKAFKALQNSEEVYHERKIAIFIDGLDLYKDDTPDLVDYLASWAKGNTGVKICVSYRESPRFHPLQLNAQAEIRLHEVNRGAIARLVRERLAQHRHFHNLGSEVEKESLLQYIISRSDGLFLWAVPVVRDLKEGLDQCDSLGQLSTKAQSLPAELNKLFKHMLSSVKENDEKLVYSILSMALACRRPLPLLRFSFLEDYLSSKDFAKGVMPALTQYEVRQRLHEIESRISGSCKGLLEITKNANQREPTFEAQVKFTHDSVICFLQSEETFHKMAVYWAQFDPLDALCQTFLAHIKSVRHDLGEYASALI
ncbi:hypothetical protein BDV18DRAFT_157377 [Aspergillus unguis]